MLGRPRPLIAPPRAVAAKPQTARPPWRQIAWGCVTAAALAVAIVASRSDVGAQRAAFILSSLSATHDQAAQHAFDAEAATRQLAQAMRSLTDDHDRLAKRVAAVERDMDDITGSIKKQIEEAKTEATATSAPTPGPWPIDAPPVPMTPADVAAMVKSVSPPPGDTAGSTPSPPDTAASGAPAYGADIGSALSINALHARWTGLRFAHPQIFRGLQPVVSLRENPRTNHTELHLVVGPYPNAAAAAQLCALLAPFRQPCQPTMFGGNHLALQ